MSKLLFKYEIDDRTSDLPNGDTRKAARAVIVKDGQVLVMRSTNKEVKFPGGGLKKNETYARALIRETLEEAGINILSFDEIGEIIEKRDNKFVENNAFTMISKYFLCEISEDKHPQKLDDYEKKQHFEPDFIKIEEAIKINENALLIDPNNKIAKRELMVFKELLNHIDHKKKETSLVTNKKTFVSTTLNGMTYGLFATLIIGTIIGQIAAFFGDTIFGSVIMNVGSVLKGLMGVGIGVGIALSLKQNGLKLVSIAIAGAIATSFKITFYNPNDNTFNIPKIVIGPNNDPLIVYFIVVVVALFIMKVMTKPTNFDILLIPLTCAIVAIAGTFILSAPVDFIINIISKFIKTATDFAPFIMSIVLSISMGMLLTMPISSVAIATIINIGGEAGSIGAAAAVIGCSTQMIGFAIQSIRDNKIGTVLSVGFGTSMLQFKNIVKKPVIWLPTIISSAILGPIGTMGFKMICSTVGAGMGTSGLVGVLQVLGVMDYSLNAWFGVIVTCIIGPAILVFLLDLLFRKLNLIKKGDLEVSKNI